VSQVLGNDAGTGLVLLLNVIVVLVLSFRSTGSVGASNVVDTVGGFYVDSSGPELSVVEEESSLRSAAVGIN
jgi:hypothetical protein